jgi:HK97 family phage portal protein
MDLTSLFNKGVRDVAWDSPEQVWAAAGNSSAGATGGLSLAAIRQQKRNLTPTEQYELSIAVNAAVNVISSQISKAKLRLFSRNGEEINGGPLYELFRRPSKRMTIRRFVREIVCWFNIAGEYAIHLQAGPDGVPVAMTALNPYALTIERPSQPRTLGDVAQWKYWWADGTTELIRADYLPFDKMFNPNHGTVRGLSPLVTGGVQVSGSVAAERYNKTHFDNGGIPSHLIVLPDGTPYQHRKDFEQRYLAEHGYFGDNAHKVMVVAGKDVRFESLEEPFQDGAFMQMMQRGDVKVAQLYRIPAINAGIYDKTRYDSAPEERKVFFEETLQPECESISECFQHQIVDPHFAFSKFSVSRPRRHGEKVLTKSMDCVFEKARFDRPDSSIIALIDTDTLPIANEIALAKMEHVEKLQEAAMISPADASEFVGLDIKDDREERSQIWSKKGIVCITKPELNAQLTPGVGGGPGGQKPGDGGAGAGSAPGGKPNKPSKSPAKKELTADDRNRLAQAKRTLFDLRKLALSKMDGGEMFGLADGDALNTGQDKAVWAEIRAARHALRKICEDGALDKAAKVEQAREWFNKYKPSHLRKMLGL